MDSHPSSAIAPGRPGQPAPRRPSIVAASLLWGAVLGILLARAGLHPHKLSSLATYLAGGAAWIASKPIYTNWRGFVYPPVIAWFFSLLTRLPLALTAVLWRLLTAGAFFCGLDALLRSNVFHRIPAARSGLVILAVLPLSIGNIDNAQANPLVAGLMMLSVAAFQTESWTLSAFAIALATTFKIYPIALALLLCILRPRQLIGRITIFLLLLALLPFLFKDPHYVSAQYHAWLQTRLADDRFQYPMKDAPLDLWYLLARLGNLPVSEKAYAALQALSGFGLAAFVWLQSRRTIPRCDILSSLFLLVSVWMLLLGPATENQTYVVLAPAVCLFAVQSLSRPIPIRILALSAFALLLTAVARNSLAPFLKNPLCMTLQPVAALLLLAAILMDLPTPTPASPP